MKHEVHMTTHSSLRSHQARMMMTLLQRKEEDHAKTLKIEQTFPQVCSSATYDFTTHCYIST